MEYESKHRMRVEVVEQRISRRYATDLAVFRVTQPAEETRETSVQPRSPVSQSFALGEEELRQTSPLLALGLRALQKEEEGLREEQPRSRSRAPQPRRCGRAQLMRVAPQLCPHCLPDLFRGTF